ncbi:prolyl oligopeptidase family serine peptidase [Aquimarina mytili]|uniref:prolyl oligopeptidase n=1 Tax=Aquimarina mytili TaxID=874423 RepID=A0A936ZWE1_9FLAO|nr:prolyl oligopeptidase family serine peptidase [Aquimarina mytili]MBL0685908.1 S9 family peptidase [Aquimarina mytili]
MYRKFVFIFVILSPYLILPQDKKDILPPKTVIEIYHGQKIEDPYRYAENLNNPQVSQWIQTQNKISTDLLNRIEKKQYLIDKQIEFDTKKEHVITKLKVTENDNHFYLKRLPNENAPKLYYRKTFSSKEEFLYDPKEFDPNSKAEYIINYIQPNWDGSKIVVSITTKGKEVSQMIIIDVPLKKVLPEVIDNAWPSYLGGVTWLPDNTSFIYLHYPCIDVTSMEFLNNTKSVLYKLGDDPKSIKEIFSYSNNPKLKLKEDDFPIIKFESKESKYLIGKTPGVGSYYNSYYLPIDEIETKNWKPLFKKSHQVKKSILKGDSIIFQTSKNAPNFKICITSIINPNFDNPKILVKENKHEVITGFELTKDGLYVVKSKNGVKASLYKYDDKTIKEIKLPKVYGNINITAKGLKYSELWITAIGWTSDNKRYEYDNHNLIDKNLNETISSKLFDEIIVEEIEIEAHDGEKIPLSILYKKGTQKDGKNRLLMDGYGAYGISFTPTFSLRRLLWVLEGGIFATAHVRGGGEKGDAWHKGGYKSTKPNTWKDFISCAEYLVSQKYTSKEKLAIWSGSAGGIMVGRAITEKPDLFAAAIIEFGSLNMLRSEMRANGATNIKEFGALSDSTEFKSLLKMDAYHHIKYGEEYPATLLTAGLNDARVPAWFSVKFAAKLLMANISEKKNLLLIDKDAGHGIDNTKLKQFERFATVFTFAFWQTGHPDYQPKNSR